MTWTGSYEIFMLFIQNLNKYYPSIEFDYEISTLKESFLRRGYTESEIDKQINKASLIPKSVTLKETVREDPDKIVFVTTFNQTNPDIQRIVRKHWHLLHLDPAIGKCFVNEPMFAFRKNKTLKNLLGRNKFNPIPAKDSLHGSSEPCTVNKRLKCCKHINETNTFKSNVTNKFYTIRHKSNCKSSNVIYLLECTLCKMQYVGKTETPFYLRLNNYRNEVKRRGTSPSAKHFLLPEHDFEQHAKFTLIERIEKPDNFEDKTRFIEEREDKWIKMLKTLSPSGINASINHPQMTTGIL